MILIPLLTIPRQELQVALEQSIFDITLIAIQDMMYANVVKDGITLISGTRCTASAPLLPYPSLEGLTGNLFFITQNDANPWYSEFGITQQLIYATYAEVQAERA